MDFEETNPPVKKSSRNLDHLTEIIGRFGRYQTVISITLSLTVIMHCWQMMANKFYTYKTDYWCSRPSDFANFTVENWRNLSTPWKIGNNNESVYDNCKIFNVNFSAISTRPEENMETIPCTSWEYQSIFDETITKRWDLVCGELPNFGRIVQTVFYIGNGVGVLLIGPYSDWLGRKMAYMTALTIWCAITLIGYFVNNPYLWLITRFIAGGASISVNTAVSVYIVELTSGSWRAKSCHWFGELPWQLGHITLGLLVYLIPNMKNLELFIGLSALPFMSLWYFLPESPRWLLSKGRNKEAIEVLRLACKWNKKDASKIDNLKFIHQEENVKMGTFKDLFRFPSIRRNAFCMTICWLAFSMGYFGLVYNTPTFDWNIYLVFVLPVFFTLPICLVQPWIENKLGRKPLMTFPLLVAGVVLLLTTLVPRESQSAVIILAWIGQISCGVAFGDGYTYTKELFPTILRTTALGTASAGARVGSLSSPLIAMLGDATGLSTLPLAIYGLIVLAAGIVSLWLWPETKNQNLFETLEEADNIASTRNPWVKKCKRTHIEN